jgi:hypothetical protein
MADAPAATAAVVADPTAALINRALAALLPAGQVTELRAPKAKGKGDFRATVSGYFNSVPKLVEESKKIDAPGVYVTLNPVDPRLLARCNNRVKTLGKGDASANDRDILCRRWLFIEADSIRPSGICATSDEKAEAKAVADALLMYLRGEGWPEPMQIDSGNGYHLFFRIDLPTDDGGLVERCLKALAHQFDTVAAYVDVSVANPSRIIRMPGSWNKKGDRTPDRPYRKCVPLSVPDELQVVPDELLEALAGTAPVIEKKASHPDTSSHSGEFEHRLLVPEYLTEFGVETLGTNTGTDGQKRWWVVCPFNPDHKGKDAYVVQYPNGAVGFHCSHNSCAGVKWEAFKEKVGKPRNSHYDPPMTTGEKGDGSADADRWAFFNPDGGIPVSVASLSHLIDWPGDDGESGDGESTSEPCGQGVEPDVSSPPGGASSAPSPNMFQVEMQNARERERNGSNALAFLCRLARQRFELFCASNGLAFASPDRVTAYPVEGSTRFSDQLYRLHREFVSRSVPPQSSLIGNAVKALAAEARLNGVRPVLQRSGWHNGSAYIYRADPQAPNEVLVIGRDGVTVTTEPPMRFAVRNDAGTIPRPAVTGSIEALRPFLNIENPDQFPIIAAWVAAVVAASFPVRLLMISGEQGTAKSTFAELVLRLVDPTLNVESDMPEEPLRGVPKDEETLAVGALHSHLLAFDNLSGLSNDLSDLFCRVVTGGMFSTRTKFTTTDETRIYLRRPVIFTGIDLPSFRGDLLERMLTVPLKKIDRAKRETKRRLFERFDAVRPEILAALYQLIVCGMNSGIDLGDMALSRMADFDEFAARAVGRATVEKEMEDVDFDNAAEALQGHPFIPTLLKFLSTRPQWRGTASDLLECLQSEYKEANGFRDPPNRWPQAAHILSGQIKKAAPALLTIHGIRITTDKEKGRKRTRYIVFDNPSATAERPQEASAGRSRASGERIDDLAV